MAIEAIDGLHKLVVHFPIAGFTSSFLAGFIALLLDIRASKKAASSSLSEGERLKLYTIIDRFEFASYYTLVTGWLGLLVAGLLGLNDADNRRDFDNELIIYKITMAGILLLLTTALVVIKTQQLRTGRKMFGSDFSLPLDFTTRRSEYLFFILLAIMALLTILVGAAGGKYVWGSTIMEKIGFDPLIP